LLSIKEGIKMKKYTVMMIIIALVLCFSAAPSATAASDEEEVLQIVTTFTKALPDFNLMSKLWWHSPKASSFEPGSVPFLIQGWENVETWWRMNSTEATEGEGTLFPSLFNPQVTMLDENVALTTAYHVSNVTNPVTNETTTNIIRQTLVIQKIKGKWLVVHAHASSFPTE